MQMVLQYHIPMDIPLLRVFWRWSASGCIPTLIITGDTTIDETLVGDLPVLRKPVQGLRLRARIDALLAANHT